MPPEGQYDAIFIDALAGNDTVHVETNYQGGMEYGVTKPVWVDGGPGNDTITVDPIKSGTAPADILLGGDGNDTIQGGAGSDWISA